VQEQRLVGVYGQKAAVLFGGCLAIPGQRLNEIGRNVSGDDIEQQGRQRSEQDEARHACYV